MQGNPKVVRQIDASSAATYAALVGSFHMGMLRLFGAEAAYARLMLALTKLRGNQHPDMKFEGNPYREVLEHLERIPWDSVDSIEYVTNISHLVYATTLLDTFLTETTLFLFLLFPEAMGKERQIPLRTVIGSESIPAALTQAATMRAREISYLSFSARLQFLTESFGLRVALDGPTKEALDHYSGLRNLAVHDQGVFELRLENDGRVSQQEKTCPRHPTPLKWDQVHGAAKAYQCVFRSVAGAVLGQVLKMNEAVIGPLLGDDPKGATPIDY
jgi:hypothetical protein